MLFAISSLIACTRKVFALFMCELSLYIEQQCLCYIFVLCDMLYLINCFKWVIFPKMV